MFFKTHLAFSFFLFMLFSYLFEIEMKWLVALVFIFSSLLPDIDSASSFVGKRFKLIGWVFRHRSFFHSFLPAIILSLIVGLFSVELGYAVFFGYFSHLFIDMFNHQGIAPFYPFLKYRIRGPLKSGGMIEKVIFVFCLVGIIYLTL